MKHKYTGIIILAIIALSIVPVSLKAQDSGKNLHMLGDSAASLGRGGTGAASFGTDLFYLNPASIALHERFGIGIQYGTLGNQFQSPHLTLAIPTSYGTFGTSVRYFNMPQSTDFGTGVSVSLGGAKDFTSKIMIGLAFNFMYAAENSNNLFYIGGTIGTIYKLNGSRIKNGFGFFNPNIAFAVNFGAPIGTSNSYVNVNTLTLGYTFQFFRHNKFTLGFYNDFSAIDMYTAYPAKLGLEAVILDNFVLRGGGIVPIRDDYNYGTVTGGAGYKFKAGNFAGSINYGFTWSSERIGHHVGVNMEYGELDRTAPETKIKTDKMYVSPNHDGTQDYVLFSPGVEDKSRIKGWQLLVLDSNNQVIKKFKMSERDTIEGLTFKGFFKRLFQKKESMVVPDTIMWDGTDKSGKIVPDGQYSYSFNARDERDNIAAIKTGILYVDNTPPKVALQSGENLFSPNGDNQKDLFVIAQNVQSSPADNWKAGFKDSKGKVVKSFTWKGDASPTTISWDGKDEKGKDVPEGLYYYFVESSDKAGNKGAANIKEISLTRQFEVADITMSADYFSFKKDKEIKLFPKLSKIEGLQKWTITIAKKNKDVIKTISGKEKFLNLVTWDCKDDEGKQLDDGEYFIKLTSQFKSGNRPTSFEKKLIIDSTPPELEISHSPGMFSPDDDGNNDILTINTETEEEFGIKEWRINIYEPSGKLFKTFTGKGKVAEEIKWDGLGAGKDLVESAADYYIELEAADMAGNTAKSEKDKVAVDILVIVTERGLKMRISNIEFAFGRAYLKRKGRSILDRVSKILERYEKYDVIIEGHTDDIGNDEANLKLSELRAEAVRKYLASNGIDIDRLQIIGMGESVPLKENINTENRRRNRRVEFLLIKQSD
ncbi:MAG: OmpA family protein [bacterium]|nr:OmpA family protein [bacterium]